MIDPTPLLAEPHAMWPSLLAGSIPFQSIGEGSVDSLDLTASIAGSGGMRMLELRVTGHGPW